MTAIHDTLQTALADRYVLGSEIGRGGMATVIAAQDLRHDRAVAIKVLDPDLSLSVGAERFLREIKLVARLQHPHILPLYDSGEAGGVLFFVMPFVEGDSLRARLSREGRLQTGEAMRLSAEVASALDYAHRNGVVHRDIKPENILIQDGHAVVADFGVARALSRAGGTALTHTGIVIGTAAYMSPEQAVGEVDLDGRSDIYSLGCVLYEMLAGEPPFSGPTAQAVIAKRFISDPPPLDRTRDDLPGTVQRIVSRAMARDAVDRFATAGELAAVLIDRNGGDTRSGQAPPRRRPPLSANGEALALYESARRIVAVRDHVRLPDAIAQLERAIAIDPQFGAAEALAAVAHVLRADTDVDVETACTAAVAAAERALVHDDSLGEAHAAIGFARMLRWQWAEADTAFERAAVSSPESPVVLHWCGIYLAALGRLDDARHSLAAAVALDPQSAVLHSAGGLLAHYAGDDHEADTHFRRAAELEPSSALPLCLLGQSYAARGAFSEANAEFARAIDLAGVVPPVVIASLGCALARAGRRPEAMEKRDSLIALARRADVSPFYEAAVRAALDETGVALSLLELARTRRDGWILSLRVHPWMHRLRGEPEFSRLLAAVGPEEKLP